MTQILEKVVIKKNYLDKLFRTLKNTKAKIRRHNDCLKKLL